MIPQPEYGFKADINHYIPTTGLEELTTGLRIVAEATSYKSTIEGIDGMIEYLNWWKDNLDNDEEPRPCHKDGAAYAEMVGA